MDKPLWLYVSGPYTRGDPVVNVRNAVMVAEAIRAAGHVPIVPHLSHLWHLISPHEWEYWIALDLELLARCDGVVRITGESAGADLEEARARELGLTVLSIAFDTMNLAWLEKVGIRGTDWSRLAVNHADR